MIMPNNKDIITEEEITLEEKLYVASQWKLMWWKFKRHKLAIISGIILIFIYILGIFCGFISPYDPNEYNPRYMYCPPQRIRFIDENGFHLRPFVYGYKLEIDPVTLRKKYNLDKTKKFPIYFFVRGSKYKFWGLWETGIHLFGVKEGYIFLLGTDRMGRDMFSRILYGARISTTIGLVGVIISLFLGIIIGGFSGYYGGSFDNIVQRTIEVIRSIPTIPL